MCRSWKAVLKDERGLEMASFATYNNYPYFRMLYYRKHTIRVLYKSTSCAVSYVGIEMQQGGYKVEGEREYDARAKLNDWRRVSVFY